MLHARMTARDPAEDHRASTPLELFFDLTFVVAIAQAASSLHHGLVDGDASNVLIMFPLVFFAIFWAWVNFTWFASAYDTDDALYRLTVFVQMAGVLILAAGIPRAFADQDFGDRGPRLRGDALRDGGAVAARRARGSGSPHRRAALRDRAHRDPARMDRRGSRCPTRRSSRSSSCSPCRARAPGLGGVGGTDVVASGSHRRALRPVHDHRARRVRPRRNGRRPTGARRRQHARRSRSRRRRRSAHRVRDVVGVLRPARRARASVGPGRDSTSIRAGAFVWGYLHYFVFGAAAAAGAGLAVAVDQATGHSELTDFQAGLAITIPVSAYLARRCGCCTSPTSTRARCGTTESRSRSS